jgi:hypothetical protein
MPSFALAAFVYEQLGLGLGLGLGSALGSALGLALAAFVNDRGEGRKRAPLHISNVNEQDHAFCHFTDDVTRH